MQNIVRESDVDIRIVFIPNTRAKTIEQTAVDIVEEFCERNDRVIGCRLAPPGTTWRGSG